MSDGPDSQRDWQQSTYDRWIQREGVPIIRGLYVEDLCTVPVGYWERRGAPGAIVKLEGSEDLNDAQLVELPPGASTKPVKHFFEASVYVVQGRGATTIWNHRGDRQEFEWQAGSVFTIPFNAYYEFHNGSGTEPARYVAVTMAPLFMNLLHDPDFIFNCPLDFTDRFSGEAGHFSGEGTSHPNRIWESNFVSDVKNFKLQEWQERGAGGRNMMLELGNSIMGLHISEFPVGTYKKAHRHGAGAHVVILAGVGYSLMWKEGGEIQKIDWKPGSLLVPPDRWFHQHFNSGPEPARYLALRANSRKWKVWAKSTERAVATSFKLGGDQIEYEDQDPSVHELFIQECAKHGATPKMEGFVQPK